MSGLNLGKTILIKRKEKEITQEALAGYIGVSKASVSKWETGQSYPDITILPQLATYFNISIDELMGYSPQLTKEAIRNHYKELAAQFAAKPFDEVYQHWQELVQKYYSCLPFLLQMGILMINHEPLQPDPERKLEIYREVKNIFARVREEGRDGGMIQQAEVMEALCDMTLGNTDHAIELLKPFQRPHVDGGVMLASAYYMAGDMHNAKQVAQMEVYQGLTGLIGALNHYLNYFTQQPDYFTEVADRTLRICDTFHMEKLAPGAMLTTYFGIAMGYAAQDEQERCLEILRRYTDLNLSGIYPITLRNEDDFFDLSAEWFENLDLGINPPRDSETIKRDVVAQMSHPVFAKLQDHPGFCSLKERLEHGLLGNA